MRVLLSVCQPVKFKRDPGEGFRNSIQTSTHNAHSHTYPQTHTRHACAQPCKDVRAPKGKLFRLRVNPPTPLLDHKSNYKLN